MNGISRTHLMCAATAMGVALLNAPALWALGQLALGNPTVSHVVGVPLIACALIYNDRDIIFKSAAPSPLAGGLVVVAGLALSMLARLSGSPLSHLTAEIAGVAVAWFGCFVAFYGLRSARAAVFPLGFLALMIPLPSAVVDGATLFLKTGSSEAVSGLFSLTGTPFHRQGFVFSLPNVVIEIADECSGIRSSIALLVTGLLAGHQFLRSPWTRIALVLLVIPIAVLKNAVRIVGLSLLAIYVDPSFLSGPLHHEGGFVFFLFALALLAPVLVMLRRSERAMSNHPSPL